MIKISHLNIFFIFILIFQVPISFSYAQVKIDVNKMFLQNTLPKLITIFSKSFGLSY